MAAGDLLIKAKGHISHGQWGEFVEGNCKISLRTAQTYIQMARDRATIESKAQSSAHLDLSIAGGAQAHFRTLKAKSAELCAFNGAIAENR
jgi:hypothetical protein